MHELTLETGVQNRPISTRKCAHYTRKKNHTFVSNRHSDFIGSAMHEMLYHAFIGALELDFSQFIL